MLNSPGIAFSSTLIMVWLQKISLNSFGFRLENSADFITRKHDCLGVEICRGTSTTSDNSLAANTNIMSVSTCSENCPNQIYMFSTANSSSDCACWIISLTCIIGFINTFSPRGLKAKNSFSSPKHWNF